MFRSRLAPGSADTPHILTLLLPPADVFRSHFASISAYTPLFLTPPSLPADVFRSRLASGSADEDSLLEEAFAVVREASKRVLGMRHFDCQMVGGHQGKGGGGANWLGMWQIFSITEGKGRERRNADGGRGGGDLLLREFELREEKVAPPETHPNVPRHPYTSLPCPVPPPTPHPPPISPLQVGGMVLHEGQIAEMATGEGKTLVATLPVYLNARRR